MADDGTIAAIVIVVIVVIIAIGAVWYFYFRKPVSFGSYPEARPYYSPQLLARADKELKEHEEQTREIEELLREHRR